MFPDIYCCGRTYAPRQKNPSSRNSCNGTFLMHPPKDADGRARRGHAASPARPRIRHDQPKAAYAGLLNAIKFGNEAERLDASKRLEETADASVSAILLDELRGRNPETQLICAKALANLADARAVPVLIGLAGQGHPYGFDLFVFLAGFGDSRAVPLMEKMLESDDSAFRAAAAEGLGKSGFGIIRKPAHRHAEGQGGAREEQGGPGPASSSPRMRRCRSFSHLRTNPTMSGPAPSRPSGNSANPPSPSFSMP